MRNTKHVDRKEAKHAHTEWANKDETNWYPLFWKQLSPTSLTPSTPPLLEEFKKLQMGKNELKMRFFKFMKGWHTELFGVCVKLQ